MIPFATLVAVLATLSPGPVPHAAANRAAGRLQLAGLADAHRHAGSLQARFERLQLADSADVHDQARSLQARFERLRVRELPRSLSGGGHECDEIIGRLCVWDDGDDGWRPREEPEEIGAARTGFLAALDSLARLIPGDHWIFGQRIRYLVEAGRLGDAESLALACGLPDRWRCDAHLGHVRHRAEDIGGAERAFARMLLSMPSELRAEWADPGPLLDRGLRDWLSAQADSSLAADRLWMLADPLFLTAGNDRWTGHLSRWVYAMSSEGARNPHRLRWGDDMAEAAVRYGWPVAWERSWPRGGSQTFTVTGRDNPAAVRTFPPDQVLDLAGEDAVQWEIPDGHTRSVHLPPFLDSLAPLDGQVGRFWRRDGVIVAAAWAPPPPAADTPPPAADGAGLAPGPVEAGLFVEHSGTLQLNARTASRPGETVRLSGLAPWTDWGIVSFEVMAPAIRRAYRLRTGVGLRRIPPDALSISDLVLLDGDAEPAGFDEMLDVLRGSGEVAAGDALGVALEVYGLGFRSEAVEFDAWVERRDRGVLSRAVRWLGFGGPKEEVSVSWEEAGPDRPRPLFRAFRIGLPDLDAGEYEVVVEVSVQGSSPLAGRRSFRVR